MRGRKKGLSADDWAQAWAAERCFPAAELARLVDQAVRETRAAVQGQRAAIAWSSGKESRALEVACRLAGVEGGVNIVSPLAYPVWTRWLQQNQPPDIVTRVSGPDLLYLREHPQFLFPQPSALRHRYRSLIYLRGQQRFMQERGITLFVTGHRSQDGNFCPSGSKFHVGRGGVVRFSPLRDWPHGAVLQLLKDSELPLSPIYALPDGWRYSAVDWPRRPKVATVEEGLRQTWAIDPDIVREAAEVLPQARDFVETHEGGLANAN